MVRVGRLSNFGLAIITVACMPSWETQDLTTGDVANVSRGIERGTSAAYEHLNVPRIEIHSYLAKEPEGVPETQKGITAETVFSKDTAYSGILIRENVVLTTARWVIPTRETGSHDGYDWYWRNRVERVVFTGMTPDSGGTYQVKEIAVHPGYRYPYDVSDYDIALLRLDRAVPLISSVVLSSKRYTVEELDRNDPDNPIQVNVIGWDGGERREGWMNIAFADEVELYLKPSPSESDVFDEGGPVFLTNGDLIGMIVEGSPPTRALRLDRVLDDFILPTLAQWEKSKGK